MYESPGAGYLRFCRLLGRAKHDPAVSRARADEIRRLEAEVQEARKHARSLELSGSTRELLSMERSIARKTERLDRLNRVHQQKDFKRAMRITGMGLRVEEVVRFASVSAVIALVLAVSLSALAGLLAGLELFMLIILVIGAGISAPLAVFMLIVSYPERLAKELELEAFGSAPEIVNYMVMSMELSPSIDRALEFAAENAQGPMARELEALVWKIQTRQYSNTEEALADYARELEGMNEEMRSALYNILSASKEKGRETMRSSLARASDMVLTGTRQRVEDFSASLGTPATVLFALGILLPMIIGSMLPMISLGGFDIGANTEVQEGWAMTLVISISLMNVLFPAFAFFYSRRILGRRPGIHSFSVPDASTGFRRRLPAAILIVIVFMVISWMVATRIEFWGIEGSIAALTGLTGAALAAGYLLSTGGRDRSRIKELEKLEDQMPDMLFQLGSRLTEGMALERALEDVARSMEGTEAGDFLSRIMARLERSGTGLEELLFSGEGGMLEGHPSRKLGAAMKLVVEASGKNPETAGGVLMSMSNHMRELANTDRDMRTKLRATIDSMKNTALLFAPVIMGVTVGLYRLLSQTFGEMNGAETMPVPYFILIMGVYLLMTVAIIISFCSGIERGRGRWRGDVAVALPVSAIIYSVSALGALLAFG